MEREASDADESNETVQLHKQLVEKDKLLVQKDEELTKLKEKIAHLELNAAGGGEQQPKRVKNAWDPEACSPFVDIANKSAEVKPEFQNSHDEYLLLLVADDVDQKGIGGTVRAKLPLQKTQGVCYFEVILFYEARTISVGLVTHDCPLSKHVGRTPESYGYTSLGELYVCGRPVFELIALADDTETIGCGMKSDGQLFFTMNGKMMLEGDTPLPKLDADVELFPAATLFGIGTKVEANFGDDPDEPFLFDLNTLK